jgi:hypothetical protein
MDALLRLLTTAKADHASAVLCGVYYHCSLVSC